RSLALTLAALAATMTACSPPPPRGYDFFMEDSIARDGVLARCDRNPDDAQRDIECANARRAATAVLLREERARREALERESERKLAELRRQVAAEQEALRAAEEAAAAAAREAYEAQWDGAEPRDVAGMVDAAGAADAVGVAEAPSAADAAVAIDATDGAVREGVPAPRVD